MAKKKAKRAADDETAYLLRYLVVIELYRFGLSKQDIRERLSMDLNTVTEMLRGVKRQGET
jgi:transposase